MKIKKLITWNFRNIENAVFEPEPGLNLILGFNGQGKTNLLEAVAVLGNVRSFRQAAVRKMVRHGNDGFRIEAWISNSDSEVHLRQIVRCSSPVVRSLEINGVKVSLDRYLMQIPVFTLSAADVSLVTGPPDHRRSFIDRMAFFFDFNHLKELNQFRKNLRQRNAALTVPTSKTEMDIWEDGLARTAASVVYRRIVIVSSWKAKFHSMYDRLRGEKFPDVDVEYRWEFPSDGVNQETVAKFYRQRYHDHRVRDCRAGFTIDGPHRHDLVLRADGRPVRDVLSAGQVKVVAAALWMSNLAQVEERRNERCPILVDDADAELDSRVFGKLVDSFGSNRQVMMASAHDRVLENVMSSTARWMMVGGKIQKKTYP